ncbi:ubiquitin-protein ligase [Citrus sinensis]|uniref:F-box/LRR-repeat protein 3 isoform X2 n=1 Tax=Citrus sinensis TaxID=2711 RepID=UPI002196DAD8|nr:F-box/LRR-repeat protein 3 isoform X2 [Citrus sinensis]KAH9689528.1 ubiquitin-protein ligase [Citrus sinensis]
MPGSSALDVLTEDLLVRVREKIGDELDSKTWRLVCKEFSRVDSVTRTTLRVLRVEFLFILLDKYPYIKTLDLSVCPRVNDGTVSFLLSQLSLSWTRSLKSLILSRSTGLRYRGLEMLARACPLLESVDVSYCCGFGDREAAALSFASGLKEVKLDKCLNVTDVGLAKIAVRCVNLERLSLKWCMEISDLGIDLLCKKCLDLKSLDVSYLKLTNDSFCSIATLAKLESLVMVGCPCVDDTGLRFLESGCPLLKTIFVSRCKFVSSTGLISVIRGHSGLLQLDAGHCFSELSTTLLHHMRDLKNLEAITMDGARISDSCFQTISFNCKSLVEIGLSKCLGVTNTDSCRGLVCLKIESCNMITEKGLYQLGSFCLQLEEIDLTDCNGVNDKGLEYLSRCSELLFLKLGLCENISDKGLFYIASNCLRIQGLDLYKCSGIGDDGLAALSNGCKKLKKLNLSYCVNVTDRGMEHIRFIEDLSDLELRGLTKITSAGLTALAAGCKRLADLDLKHCAKIDDSGFWALAYYSQNLRQINLSYCALSDMALCMVMGNMTRLQDAKLVHLTNCTREGFELALRSCCMRIKKVKLLAPIRFLLSSEILETLHAAGCKIRWD